MQIADIDDGDGLTFFRSQASMVRLDCESAAGPRLFLDVHARNPRRPCGPRTSLGSTGTGCSTEACAGCQLAPDACARLPSCCAKLRRTLREGQQLPTARAVILDSGPSRWNLVHAFAVRICYILAQVPCCRCAVRSSTTAVRSA